MRKILKRVALVLGVLLLLALLFPLARIVFLPPGDDREHLERKRAYLERVAGNSRRSAAGTQLRRHPLRRPGLRRHRRLRQHRHPHAQPRPSRRARCDVPARLRRLALLLGLAQPAADRAATPCAPAWITCCSPRHRQGPAAAAGLAEPRCPAEEITLAEVLSAAGYATAAFGKWHLGDEVAVAAERHGVRHVSTAALQQRPGQARRVHEKRRRSSSAIPIDQTTLTRRYTERAVAFIEAHAGEPFFLYLPHTFPHIPLHASTPSSRRSEAGLYGDVVEELDDSVGAVLDALERKSVSRRRRS